MRKRISSAMAALIFGWGWWAPPLIAAQEMPPATSSTPRSHRMPVQRRLSYSCAEGKKVVVFLRELNARVIFAGKTYSMKMVESRSGKRYSDGSIVWRNDGQEGVLEDATNVQKPVIMAAHCKLERVPEAVATSVVSGTVAYRERIAMPENAVLTMQLQDVSLAETPAKVIAEQKFTFAGHQVPLPFELHYDPAKMDPKHTYALSARITVNEQLMFMNTTTYRVITQGNPVKADILLQMVEGQTSEPKHQPRQ